VRQLIARRLGASRRMVRSLPQVDLNGSSRKRSQRTRHSARRLARSPTAPPPTWPPPGNCRRSVMRWRT
jgi:hypothetical protein